MTPGTRDSAGAKTTGAEARLAESYNHMLLADPSLARDTRDQLEAGQRETGLFIQGRYLCNVLRPRFLSETRRVHLDRVSRILYGLFERAGDVLLRSDTLLDAIHATDQERELWAVDPGYSGFTVTSRLDSFMPGTEPRFVEYNAESPASIGFNDVLTRLFGESPAMRAWSAGRRFDTFDVRRSLLDLLLWAYREWGGTGTPSIAVIDWRTVITARDFELCAEYFVEQGIPTVIADPRELRYSGGKLWAGDRPVDLVYRRVLLHELLERADEAADVLRAYRDGAICMVNSARSKLLHKKSVMALLSEGALDLDMTPEERSVVDATIPWTRRVVEGTTTYEGETVDLVSLLRGNQDRLVIKPSDDYGGRGVILGWEVDRRAWSRAIEQAVGDAYVVQERVPVPQAEFPVWADGRAAIEPLHVDIDPLLFRGEMGGILTRISGHALLNVSAGTGSSAPTFLIADEEADHDG